MFTGIVRSRGNIRELRDVDEGRVLVVAADLPIHDLAVGASVSVSGVCLTVVHADDQTFTAQAAFETLEKTTLGHMRVEAAVNLEPAMRAGDAFGGHLVMGHVDGVARVRSIRPRGDARELWIDIPHQLLRFVAPKGSIALDGVSLTVNDVDADGCMVGVVPHTLSVTTFQGVGVHDEMNVEVDLMARYVVRALDVGSGAQPPGRGVARESNVTLELLREAGFVRGDAD